MFWIIFSSIELTYLMTELNEWDSAHSYYRRELKIAPQFNLKARTAHVLKNLNLVYFSNCFTGMFLLFGCSFIIIKLNTLGLPYLIAPIYLVCLVITLLLVNATTTLIDNVFNNHLQLRSLLSKREKKRYGRKQ